MAQLFKDTDEFFEVSPPQLIPPEEPLPKYTVYVPGWQDIIHVYPEGLLPYQEQLRLKRERARRIAESPTPEIVRSIGSIMTWIDDIQDALVTISVAGRIIARTAPRILPYVGWVATAADTLNLLNLWGAFGLLGHEGKRGVRTVAGGSPWSQKARLMKSIKTGKVLPGLGEWLQILQTTDTLFGVGISLGPIVGFYEDIYFAWARGEPVRWESPILSDYHMAAFKALKAIGPLSLVLNDLSPEDQKTCHVANRLSWALVQDFLQKIDWPGMIKPYLSGYYRPPGPRNELTLKVLSELGYHSSPPGPWPLPGSPLTINPLELHNYLLDQGPSILFDLLDQRKKTLEGKALALLASDTSYLSLRAISDEPGDLQVLESDLMKAAWLITHYQLLDRKPVSLQEGIPRLREISDKMTETGLNALPASFVAKIWKK